MDQKRLYRTEDNTKMIAGVCAGIAEYFNIDPTLVRVAWAIATVCGSAGFWIYLACCFIVPKKSNIYPD